MDRITGYRYQASYATRGYHDTFLKGKYPQDDRSASYAERDGDSTND